MAEGGVVRMPEHPDLILAHHPHPHLDGVVFFIDEEDVQWRAQLLVRPDGAVEMRLQEVAAGEGGEWAEAPVHLPMPVVGGFAMEASYIRIPHGQYVGASGHLWEAHLLWQDELGRRTLLLHP